jgi:2-desacetyl-2-hydroxyethyl bacteriochlorophyllide A dehydrogenase
MKAALYAGIKNLSVEELPLQKIDNDDIVIKVDACGVCGTDFHIFNGEAPAKVPVVIGHEYVGEVVETGKNAVEFHVGEKVAIDPNIYCGYCSFCREGKINLCKNLKALGVTLNGGMAQYSVVPQKQAFHLPQNFPIKNAAFAEPLSCCIHGIERAEIRMGNTVAVLGMGTIGLLMIQLARMRGASKIISIDPVEEKFKIAENLHADYTLNPLNKFFHSDFENITSGGADIVIECVGNQSAAELAFKLIKPGGRIVIFGMAEPAAAVSVNLQLLFHKELIIKSSLLNPFTFQTAVDLLISNKIRVDVLNPFTIPLQTESLDSLFSKERDKTIIKYMVIP